MWGEILFFKAPWNRLWDPSIVFLDQKSWFPVETVTVLRGNKFRNKHDPHLDDVY